MRCTRCGKKISFANHVTYNNQDMCPACVYEVAPEDSPVRWQMEHNYPDEIKKPAEKAD